MVILAPIAAMLVQMAISRTREYAADELGARISGRPDALASALVKISNAAQQIPNAAAERNPATAHLFIINPLTQRTGWTTCSRPIRRPRTASPRSSDWRAEMGRGGFDRRASTPDYRPRPASPWGNAGGRGGPWG